MRKQNKPKALKYKLSQSDNGKSLEFEAKNLMEALEIAIKSGTKESNSLYLHEVS